MSSPPNRPDFQKVLRRKIGHVAEVGFADAGDVHMSTPFVREKEGLTGSPDTVQNAYRLADLPKPNRPVHQGPVTVELGDLAGLTRPELDKLRRRYALQNHPDRLGSAERKQGLERMSTANRLIDEAILKIPE